MQHQFQYVWLHRLLRNYESPTKVVCNLLQRCHIKCCCSFLFFHKYFQVMSRENVEWQSNSSDKHLMCSNGFSLAIAQEYFVNLGNRTYMIQYIDLIETHNIHLLITIQISRYTSCMITLCKCVELQWVQTFESFDTSDLLILVTSSN